MNTEFPYETNLYYERDPAERVVERLHSMGYGSDEISIAMDDKTREKAFAAEINAKTSEGIAAGATAGGVLGAIVAGMTATGSVAAIVGTGGVATPLVAGPLAAALAGLGAGAVGGGVLGGLIGLGVGEKHAHEYEKGLKEGGILVAVRPKSKEQRDHVRRAMDLPAAMSATTGTVEPAVDYAGEVNEEETLRQS